MGVEPDMEMVSFLSSLIGQYLCCTLHLVNGYITLLKINYKIVVLVSTQLCILIFLSN